jgi:carbon-monoxide dehydrogenase small subunit
LGGERRSPLKKELRITVNGNSYHLLVETHHTLLEVIRNDIGLTGTKNACGMGECGACTVLLEGEPVNACLVLAHEADGQKVLTIEVLSHGETLHPIQKAFVDHGAIQCGFCTPGMIMSAKTLLDRNPKASRDEIRKALEGNLCRCTGYVKIVEAVEEARDMVQRGGRR